MPKEFRHFTEFRVQRADDEPTKLIGYAAVFNQLSENLGGFREKIKKGAFKETIKKDDIRALIDHKPDKIIGRTTNGTLILKEDSHGLSVEITPPDTQVARDLITNIESGLIDSMSFGFNTIDDKWEVKDGVDIRTLLEAQLGDVSPVTFPAYPQTEIEARSLVHENAISENRIPRSSGDDEGEDNDTAQKCNVDVLKKRIDLDEDDSQEEYNAKD